MPLHGLQHSKYAKYMHTICINMHQICIKYAENMQKICHYIDFNIANMHIICKKNMQKNMLNMQQNIQKICNQYVEYA